jgi:hypothetical protein
MTKPYWYENRWGGGVKQIVKFNGSPVKILNEVS